jgi:hypothetical protein
VPASISPNSLIVLTREFLTPARRRGSSPSCNLCSTVRRAQVWKGRPRSEVLGAEAQRRQVREARGSQTFRVNSWVQKSREFLGTVVATKIYVHAVFCTGTHEMSSKGCRRLTDLENAQIKDHIACGTSPKEITALTGVHYSTVMRIKKNIEVFGSPQAPRLGKMGRPALLTAVFYTPRKTYLVRHLATYHFFLLRSRRITCGAEGILVKFDGVFNAHECLLLMSSYLSLRNGYGTP